MNLVNVATRFQRVEGMGRGLPIVLLVKYKQDPRDLLLHRKEFQEARKRGRFAPLLLPLRESKWGGGFIAAMEIDDGMDPHRGPWMREGDEVRGYDAWGPLAAVATANAVQFIERRTGKLLGKLESPRFRNLHSVFFHPLDGERLLLSNTGFDGLLEVVATSGDIVWEWHAWNHGYDRNPYGFRLLTKGADAGDARVLSHGEAKARMERDDPLPEGESLAVEVDFSGVSHPLGLEKWLKSAEPNWVGYGSNPGTLLASFFVANQAVVIERESGAVRVVAEDLNRPHALVPSRFGYLVSDTRKGWVRILDSGFRLDKVLDFTGFPFPDTATTLNSEWIQFASPVGAGRWIAVVDSGRATLFLVDPEAECYSAWPFDPEWSVQSVLANE